jgi:hypothetical protein
VRLGLSRAIAPLLVLSCAVRAAAQPPVELGPSIPSAPEVAPGGAPSAPFGPGATVQVTSAGDPVTVYVARFVPAAGPPIDGEFVRIGKTPIEFQLPPGTYQIEAEGHDISNEALLFEMRSEPRRLLVHPGSEGLGVVGTLLLGIGITAVVAGIAIVASGEKAGDLDRPAIVIPIFAGGVVLGGLGVGFSVASDTDIEEPKSQGPAAPAPRALGFGATLHF